MLKSKYMNKPNLKTVLASGGAILLPLIPIWQFINWSFQKTKEQIANSSTDPNSNSNKSFSKLFFVYLFLFLISIVCFGLWLYSVLKNV